MIQRKVEKKLIEFAKSVIASFYWQGKFNEGDGDFCRDLAEDLGLVIPHEVTWELIQSNKEKYEEFNEGDIYYELLDGVKS